MPSISPGIRSMLIAAICFSTGALFIKLAGQRLPSMEILFARAVVGVCYCTFLLRNTGHSVFGTKKFFLLVRGFFGLSAFFGMFYAFVHLPLADATVLVFAHPIFVAILAPFVLKERLGTMGTLCVAIAITGVVLVAKPSFLFGHSTALDPLAVAIAIGGALCSGCAIVTIRFLAKSEHPLTIIAYPVMLLLVLGPIVDGHNWLMPSTREFFLLVAVGIAMNMGQHFMTIAYQKERAAIIAAIGYLEIPMAALFGAMFFGEIPDAWTYAGAALVIGGTLLIGMVKEKPAN